MSTPGFEPGLSRPQRDVLTTRRCGLEIKLALQERNASLSRVPAHCGHWPREKRTQTRRCRMAPQPASLLFNRERADHSRATPKAPASPSIGHELAALAGNPKGTDRDDFRPAPSRNCLSAPGFEPGLSRPRRDVLTTRRCSLEEHVESVDQRVPIEVLFSAFLGVSPEDMASLA